MKIKNIVMLLAAGLSTGVVMASAIGQHNTRAVSVGGEVFFVPMVFLLIWVGWIIHGEYRRFNVINRKCRKDRKNEH